MGSNNNKNSQPSTTAPNGAIQQPTGYGPNANPSGSDPRGVGQNQSQYQQGRYESQQGPIANQAAYNYGQGSTQNTADYGNIMNQYRNFTGASSPPPQQQQPQQQQPVNSPGGSTTPEPQIQQATRDPQQIDQWLQWQSQQPGSDPILQTPEGRNYYAQNIINTDGLTPSNTSYWKNKSTLAQYGGAVGAPAGGGGGGGGGYSLGSFQNPSPQAMANFAKASQGYGNFADTGGYSPTDIANLRARGTAPVRAAYANAQQNVERQRSLQGGYAPNAIATEAKMAREQGQGMSDAMQNVEAGIVNQRNANQLAGNAGLSGVGQEYGGLGFNYSQLGQQGMLGAMQGQTSLYGATPGMASTFGNQAINVVGQGGQFGNELYGNDINNQRNPGAFDTTLNRIGQVTNAVSGAGGPIVDYFQNKQQPQQTYDPANYPTVGPPNPPPDYSDQYYGYGG